MKALTFPLGDLGGLGNSLWQLAGTMGVARRLGVPAVFPVDWPYRPFLSCPDGWFGPTRGAKDARRVIGGNHWRRTYMQDPALWAGIADEVREAFAPSERAVRILDAMPQPGPDDVAVHVRRTDYLTMPDHLPVLDADWYVRALFALPSPPSSYNPEVYTDDPDWCAETMPLWPVVSMVTSRDEPEPRDWADLAMMARYRHHIIANSSYSWWAAWLSGDDHVVYPSRWYGPKIDAPNPCPSHWIGVE